MLAKKNSSSIEKQLLSGKGSQIYKSPPVVAELLNRPVKLKVPP
jgi:hypothetical protein